MSCMEGVTGVDNCNGMYLFKDICSVIILHDSCYEGVFKVVRRKQRTFPDESFINYDEVLICADKDLLLMIADTISKKFGD